MVKLSAVIITYNEEKNIGRCLDSLTGIADEILVVDSFSKDKTESICRSKGARFLQHVFEGHIEQKNYAVNQTAYPHILSLDADEALDEELRKSILEVKNNWTHDGYTMNRLTNYCGQWIYHCGWYPDRKLRLWDSRKGRWTGTNPHDRYELLTGGTQKHIAGNILHYSYYAVEEHYRQTRYFADIASRALFKKGKKAGLFEILVRPPARFIRDYFLKLGFLDGKAGFIICRITAYGTWLKYNNLSRLSKSI